MSHSCSTPRELSTNDGTTFVAEQAGLGSLRLLGELDAAGVPEVWAQLVGVDEDVELDCAGLTFIDASGVKLLVAIQAACQARGAKLSIVNPSRCLIRLIDLTGLAAKLDVRAESSAA
jgi:anti-anti-sigma factor